MRSFKEIEGSADTRSERILAGLNDAQREAVTAAPGNLLIVAGAGSGKTKVLVHRIAWLIERTNASPFEILAVTFTNKAAREMRTRTEDLLEMSIRGMWMGTFHGIAHRLLRIHWQEAGLSQNFEIMDQRDQERLLNRLIVLPPSMEKIISGKEAASFINRQKDTGLRHRHMLAPRDPQQDAYHTIYKRYEDYCHKRSLVDFGELLLRSHELWLENDEVLTRYQARFSHLLVDEFQDTNSIQYAWLRVLAAKRADIFAVGDDDQSIYGWRGAEIKNIRNYSSDLKDTKIIRLEQNYRSTQVILSAANELISRNTDRLGKSLWTSAEGGAPIKVYNAFTEFEEADFIAEKSEQCIDEGTHTPDDIAVLYRNNRQSRLLEHAFQSVNVPYRIYGGTRFYDRMEIRNVLAYMRLLLDRNADAAFERVVNVPPRRIGTATMEALRSLATGDGTSLWEATLKSIDGKGIAARTVSALKSFVELIETIARDSQDMPLHATAELCVHQTGLMDHHSKEKGESGLTRKENLEELILACEQFHKQFQPLSEPESSDYVAHDNRAIMEQFIDQATLDAGDYQTGTGAAVSLMTLHSAKGLEFPLVFIAGMEESLFPNANFNFSPDREEEERRLAYVGITRAMRQLYLTHASTRTEWGKTSMSRLPSRFITEIPPQYLTHVRIKRTDDVPRGRRDDGFRRGASGKVAHRQTAPNVGMVPDVAPESKWATGEKLVHTKFGKGRVIEIRGNGAAQQLHIEFLGASRKWITANSDKLSKD